MLGWLPYFLIFLLLIGIVLVALIDAKNIFFLNWVSFSSSLLVFFFSLLFLCCFDKAQGGLQFGMSFKWIETWGFSFSTGVDGISLFFILLTTFLFPICLLASWESVLKMKKHFLLCFLCMEGFLLLAFLVRDVLLFYIFFESILIPMFLIIGIWGSRERKIRASYLFFIYTLFGSIAMLLAILFLFHLYGTTNYDALCLETIPFAYQQICWVAFFLSFASKVPMLPLHIWLPEAHVEAPTAGSVLLAGILLKLGSYGFIRFSLPLFPEASIYFAPFVCTLSVLGILYTSLTAVRQTDLKRIIAYTSVAHMNLVTLGIFSFTTVGLEGAILQSLSHGFVSSALFLIIGVLYDRHHTRMVKYYSGLAHMMPLFTICFLFFTMANIALPGTSSFVGEFLLLAGIYKFNTTLGVLSALTMVFGGAYSLWLFNRIAYGNLKIQYLNFFMDLTLKEFCIFLPLIFLVLFMGIYPDFFLNYLHLSVHELLSIGVWR